MRLDESLTPPDSSQLDLDLNNFADILDQDLFFHQNTPVECLLSAQSKYRTVKTVLARNKILMNNDAPSKNEMDKAFKDISRFDKLELNKVLQICLNLVSSLLVGVAALWIL